MKTLKDPMGRVFASIALLFVMVIISAGCTKSTDSQGTPGANEVWIQNMAFNPATITVPAHTTITWTNKDAVAHTVTSNTGLFDSGSVAVNGAFTHLFDAPGTYAYHCTFHAGMNATVIVN